MRPAREGRENRAVDVEPRRRRRASMRPAREGRENTIGGKISGAWAGSFNEARP